MAVNSIKATETGTLKKLLYHREANFTIFFQSIVRIMGLDNLFDKPFPFQMLDPGQRSESALARSLRRPRQRVRFDAVVREAAGHRVLLHSALRQVDPGPRASRRRSPSLRTEAQQRSHHAIRRREGRLSSCVCEVCSCSNTVHFQVELDTITVRWQVCLKASSDLVPPKRILSGDDLKKYSLSLSHYNN